MALDFGKDLGVLHEAVITGRKVAADSHFWGSLAQSERAFKIVMSLAPHIAAIEKHKIDIDKMPTVEAVKEFFEWLGKDCFTCYDEHDLIKVGLVSGLKDVPQGDFDRQAIMEQVGERMIKIINIRITQLGIHPAEIVAVAKRYPPYNDRWVGRDSNQLVFETDHCIEGLWLQRAISTIVVQRHFIKRMYTVIDSTK
ncbi:MAG: hypothetical protein NTV02_03765 [Candidatus Zambryskibacteria bacterium]|nr:hypothetical protein [Candidatus Zambryskibacteria bacterium]